LYKALRPLEKSEALVRAGIPGVAWFSRRTPACRGPDVLGCYTGAPCPIPVHVEVRVPWVGRHPLAPLAPLAGTPLPPGDHQFYRALLLNSGSGMAPGPGRPIVNGKRKCTPAPTAFLLFRPSIIPPWKTVPCMFPLKVDKFGSTPTYFPVPGPATPFQLFSLV